MPALQLKCLQFFSFSWVPESLGSVRQCQSQGAVVDNAHLFISGAEVPLCHLIFLLFYILFLGLMSQLICLSMQTELRFIYIVFILVKGFALEGLWHSSAGFLELCVYTLVSDVLLYMPRFIFF